ncbi:MAG: DNA-binding protein [Acidobacteria bacterium]|nr:MAG: DNA-binding protein [Acidobacteriota bacterium]
MPPTVYIETSIVSYLAAYPSRDLITAAHRQITHTWWQKRRPEFLIFASQVVLDESAAGDPQMASRRTEILKDVPLLEITPEVAELAATLIARLPLPPRAGADAAHIAVAAYHGMSFLLTWNCTHIANAALRPRIEKICREQGYSAPVLCTPEELAGGTEDA